MSEEEQPKTESTPASVPAPVESPAAPTPVLPKMDVSPDQTPLESPEAEDLPDRTIPIKNSQGKQKAFLDKLIINTKVAHKTLVY